ncbi:MAG: DUF4250 domain-containing protein [Clostridiales bacterium]|nr:DUF4250 domain-containing protein [Clostridiales bacterium]
MLPNDPVMLLSYVNTQLRDHYKTLDDLCSSLSIDREELILKLSSIDYQYAPEQNRFI